MRGRRDMIRRHLACHNVRFGKDLNKRPLPNQYSSTSEISVALLLASYLFKINIPHRKSILQEAARKRVERNERLLAWQQAAAGAFQTTPELEPELEPEAEPGLQRPDSGGAAIKHERSFPVADVLRVHVANWSSAELADWLRETMGLPEVAEVVICEDVDGGTAIEMEPSDWKELGAQGVKAAKIRSKLKKLAAASPT